MNFKKFLFLTLSFILFSFNCAYPQFGSQESQLSIKTYKSFDKVHPGSELKIAVEADINEGWHINSNKPYDDYLIPTELTIDTAIFKLTKVFYPQPHDYKFDFSENPLSAYEGKITLGALISIPKDIKPGSYKLLVDLGYQPCNNQSCLAPTSISDTLEIIVADKQTPTGEINQEIFKNVDLSYTPAVEKVEASESSFSSIMEESGLLLSLLLVFVWGLALNLTPCVYPLIPITIGYFGGQSEGSTKRLFLLGVLFVLGMSVTYSAVGVITALSGAVFGALLQNTYVIIFIALIFVVLSLSMFGLYEFKVPSGLMASAGGAKSGLFGAFFMGLTMGIVAAPCIGPVVLALVTFVASKQDPYLGFLIFFILSLGLGLPYLLLAIFSGKIKKLPRAGEWMESVKHIFGILLLGMAVYFILPLLPKDIRGYFLPGFMIVAALYLLFFDKMANKISGFRIFKIAFSVVLIAIAVYSLIPSNVTTIEWEPYSTKVVPAAMEEKKGMIIDFYADWCIPCKELDAMTFSDAKVIDEAKKFYTFKADMTKSLSPEVESLRNKYNIIGVPTVLVINSKGEEVKRITGFVDANEFLSIIQNVN